LIGFLGSLIFLARTRVKAPSTQAQRIPPIRAFQRGQSLGAQSEASHARLGKERETLRSFVARAIVPLTAQPLFSLLSLSSPKPADDFSSTAENCTNGGGPASSPLPRIVVAEAVPRIIGEQASGRISTAACKMSVSTLNPHLVHSISLHDVRRRALVDMHSGSARFRVRSHYCSVRVFSLSSRR
jgi:hypothetical protein